MRVWREIDEDHLFTWASALAYAWLFAIFPFLVFLLGLLPYLPEEAKGQARHYIYEFVASALPRDAFPVIWNNVEFVLSRPRTGLLSIGLLLTVWGASGGMNATISAIDKCYEIEHGRPFYKQRPLAILLTVVAAFLVIMLLVLLPVGTVAIRVAERYWGEYVQIGQGQFWIVFWVWRVARYPLAILMMFALLNIVYHFGTSIRQRFVFITPGAVFVVMMWFALGFTFRLYVDKFGKYNETYGTVGGVAIILLIFYLDAAVLLIGAQINSEIDFEVLKIRRGSRDFRTKKEIAEDVAKPAPAGEPVEPEVK